jgi:hypothetical protein
MSDTGTTGGTPAATPPTPAEMAAAQAVIDAGNAAAAAAANAAALAVLTPVNVILGPTFAGVIATLKANLPAVMNYDMATGQAINNMLITLESGILIVGSKYTAAGGVAPTT